MTADDLLIGAVLLFPVVAGLLLFLFRRQYSEPRAGIPEDKRVEPELTKPLEPKVQQQPAGARAEEGFPALPESVKEEVHYIIRLWHDDEPRPIDGEKFGLLVESLEAESLGNCRLMAYEPAKGEWETPRPETGYRFHLWCTPLVNRNGKLMPENVAAIERSTLGFAAANSLFAELPRREEVLENIELLDDFCTEVDVVLKIYLANMPGDRRQRNTVQSITELSCAEGFVVDTDGEVALYSQNERLFVLRARNGAKLAGEPPTRVLAGLRLEMDIPQLSDPAAAFDGMIAIARNLALRLHFSVVNDRTVPISDRDFRDFRARVVHIREKMDGYGVVAGSAIARTLFG